MKSKLLEVEQLTDLKYLNMFRSTFELENGRTYHYYFTSRRKLNDLTCKGGKFIDAVKVLPYFVKDGKTYVVLIKEFRWPINSYTYDLCAGLVDDQSNLEEEAKRELYEEIGGTVKNIEQLTNPGTTSSGVTDETMICFVAELESMGEQHLEDTEDITTMALPLEEIPEFLKNNTMGVSSNLMLQAFYYKQMSK